MSNRTTKTTETSNLQEQQAGDDVWMTASEAGRHLGLVESLIYKYIRRLADTDRTPAGQSPLRARESAVQALHDRWINEKQRRTNFLAWEEIAATCRRDNIKSEAQYNKFRKFNPRFPSFDFLVKKYPNRNVSELFGVRPKSPERIASMFTVVEFIDYCVNQKIKSVEQYHKHRKDANDNRLPYAPDVFYKKTWLELLGKHKRQYASYDEAKKSLSGLKLTYEDYHSFPKKLASGKYLPSTPSEYYKKEWQGWGHYSGAIRRWNKKSLALLLRDLRDSEKRLDPATIYFVLKTVGATDSVYKRLSTLIEPCGLTDEEFDAYARQLIDAMTTDVEDEDETEEEKIFIQDGKICDGPDTDRPRRDPIEKLVKTHASPEEYEKYLRFNHNKFLQAVWSSVFKGQSAEEAFREARVCGDGDLDTLTRKTFHEEYQAAMSLPLPDGYDFRVKGELALPNIMQRYTAFRVMRDRHIGNWSGVGAGKTLSAILTAGVLGAKRTVIIAFNDTVEKWAQVITEVFPQATVHTKPAAAEIADSEEGMTFFLYNYEAFGIGGAEDRVTALVKIAPDFVCVDETHMAKHRENVSASKRHEQIKGMLTKLREQNPDVAILGMTATPIVNDLHEGVTLLEMLTGKPFPEIGLDSQHLANVLDLYSAMMTHGFRYQPEYAQTIEMSTPELPGSWELAAQIIRADAGTDNQDSGGKKRRGGGSALAVEELLLDVKMPAILAALKPGTVIYTLFVGSTSAADGQEGMAARLIAAARDAGRSVTQYTGQDKSGLQAFLAGEADVLVASSPIGTGVDGLQKVCNRVVINSLPWTSVGYDQLIGRFRRQGGVFDTVEVIIPQVVFEVGGKQWSWDKKRLARVQSKRTLSNGVLEGKIPDGALQEPEHKTVQRAKDALAEMIAQIEQEGKASEGGDERTKEQGV